MANQPTTGSVSALPAIPPIPAVARILARFEREQLAGFIAVALDLLDTLDGEPDLENATDLEDDFALSPLANGFDTGRGPGCSVSDNGEQAYVEWTSMRGSQKGGPNIVAGHEDDEEDDPAEDDLEDRCLAGDDGCGPIWQHGRCDWGSEWEDTGV